jgi:hypothetical protein
MVLTGQCRTSRGRSIRGLCRRQCAGGRRGVARIAYAIGRDILCRGAGRSADQLLIWN